jgi:hypothetical protein
MTEEQIERIEQYLNGALSSADKETFENELRSNAELRKQLDFMKSLPKAVQVHAENALRKQLKEFEKTLPKVETAGKVVEIGAKRSLQGEAPAEQAIPKSISGFHWARYAAAASILLIVGLFIFRDDIFRNNTDNQVAVIKTDTLNTVREFDKINTRQVAVTALEVTRIEDGKLGFVKNSLEKKITLILEVDSTLLNGGTKYGLYKLQSDSLFLITGKLETKVSVFDCNVKAQHGQMIDSNGQLMEYEKPALVGTYISGLGQYFKIEKNADYTPLAVVTLSEQQLLKFYTR